MKLARIASLMLASLAAAFAMESPAVPVTIFGVPATVRFKGNWIWDAYVVNQRGEWISDKFKGRLVSSRPEINPPRPLVKGGRIRKFKPEDLRALFDDDPRTAFRLPVQITDYGYWPHDIIITFNEPQTVDGFIVRPGWQKDLKTFGRFEKPGTIWLQTNVESQRGMRFEMPFDGEEIELPKRLAEEAINPSPILRPYANDKNMSERLILFRRPLTFKEISVSFGMLRSPYTTLHFAHENKTPKGYVSDLLPLIVGRPTGNRLRDGLIEALRKIRDKRCQELKILGSLPDITKGVGDFHMYEESGEPRFDSFFRLFLEGYINEYHQNPSSIRLAYRGKHLWAYGYGHFVGGPGEYDPRRPRFPVLVVNEEGTIMGAWERLYGDGNELP